jgi:hypothetical protein
VWIDWVADLGDGFDSTYAVASLLARKELNVGDVPLPRGQALVMGGDEVYPKATRQAYTNELRQPYAWAAPDPDKKDDEVSTGASQDRPRGRYVGRCRASGTSKVPTSARRSLQRSAVASSDIKIFAASDGPRAPFRDPSRRTADADSHFVVPKVAAFADQVHSLGQCRPGCCARRASPIWASRIGKLLIGRSSPPEIRARSDTRGRP